MKEYGDCRLVNRAYLFCTVPDCKINKETLGFLPTDYPGGSLWAQKAGEKHEHDQATLWRHGDPRHGHETILVRFDESADRIRESTLEEIKKLTGIDLVHINHPEPTGQLRLRKPGER